MTLKAEYEGHIKSSEEVMTSLQGFKEQEALSQQNVSSLECSTDSLVMKLNEKAHEAEKLREQLRQAEERSRKLQDELQLAESQAVELEHKVGLCSSQGGSRF